MNTNLSLRLIQLFSHHASESNGDELYLKYNRKKIWPKNEKYFPVTKGTTPLQMEVELKKYAFVDMELWEYDNWFSSSYLGTFRMLVDRDITCKKVYECSLIKKGKKYSNYTLQWEVIHTKVKQVNSLVFAR